MKIQIIFPTHLDARGRPIRTRAGEGKILNLTFIYLAALTPAGHEVQVVDELFEGIDFDAPVDLVALTAMTSQAPRAYQIAREYRKRGVAVVMGGFHATFFPDEAGRHVDAVVSGEADGLWEQLLEDAGRGNLKKRYRREAGASDLSGRPTPRYDLIDRKKQRYKYYPVWVGRGCPNNCSYCTVSRFYGRQVRTRPVADVIRDIRAVSARRIMFVDDNLFAYKQILPQLFAALSSMQVNWLAQMDPAAGRDMKLLDMARDAGMETAYIGLESFSVRGLQNVRKGWADIDQYAALIENLHKRGIVVFASMILGLTKEDEKTVRETLRRLEAMKIDELALYILTPIPGSRLWDEIEALRGDLPRDWTLYDGTHAVTAPEGMAPRELETLYWTLYRRFYGLPSIVRRFARPPYRKENYLLSLLRNLLVFRTDVMSFRSVHSNDFSLLNILPGYSSRRNH